MPCHLQTGLHLKVIFFIKTTLKLPEIRVHCVLRQGIVVDLISVAPSPVLFVKLCSYISYHGINLKKVKFY